MNVDEAKLLLRRFRIVPNKVLGQHFLTDSALFSRITEYAALSKTDVVLDAGAGFGFLTRFLADRCHSVVAVEKDAQVAAVLREQVRGVGNVTVVEGDVLKVALPEFTKVVSAPPYYLSSRLVMWLLERKIACAVLVLQKEFANKLVAIVGSENYGWLTVVAHHGAAVELFDAVPKELFYPPPTVDSVIVRLVPWQNPPFKVADTALFRRMVRWLFNQRNKKLDNALVPFLKSTFKLSKDEAKRYASAIPFGERRVRELAPKDFGALANALAE
ncbi:MAG: 16S rRNA (adenine(1518)-N(6)/adenine(1519)-N(6))-dimethyltransferase RsmA [Candidatus Bathyarchaeia archaeon]